jgi:hypothetical protein
MSFRSPPRRIRLRILLHYNIKDFSPTKVGFEMTNKRIKLLFSSILIILSFTSISFSQWKHDLFPSDLNIQPFTANFLEPKAGFLLAVGQDKVRLDISTSRDIIHWYDDDESISIGADLFTFTRLRSSDNFKFPVETVDYLFGFNVGYKKKICEYEYGLRFRLSHISAHLVDGQFDNGSVSWRNNRLPFVFSKEFVELFPYFKVNSLRVYAGLTYIFHVIPEEIKKGIYQVGFDYYATQLGTDLITPFAAYDFKLSGNEKYVGNNIISAGVKFGKWDKKGFSIYYTYISGKSIHGEFFDINENYSNIGFNFEL